VHRDCLGLILQLLGFGLCGLGFRFQGSGVERRSDRFQRPREDALRLGLLGAEREFFIDNLLVRFHFIIGMNRWTGLAP